MSQLKLFLFGPPRLEREGRVVNIRRRKALALAAYLAATGQPHSREALATIFWPDLKPAAARTNLRRELSRLKNILGPGQLAIDREHIRLNAQSDLRVDVVQFQHYVAACQQHDHLAKEACEACLSRLDKAVELYTNDFLAGFTIAGSAAFDDWQFFQTESLRQVLIETLEQLTRGLQAQGEFEQAILHARRRLALDSLQEAAHRQVMQLYVHTGQIAAALRQYDLCRQTLDTELGIPPAEETTKLYERIQSEAAKSNRSVFSSAPGKSAPASNLPTETTPFVGRTEELATIVERLNDPDCRLLTLIGPGGVGKTRLAIQIGQKISQDLVGETTFERGVCFVPLTAVSSPTALVSTIADALGLDFHSDLTSKQQLLDYLQAKKTMLVLDNFEQLLVNQGADLIADILAFASGVKMLVTSREALNLQGEWLYTVPGLRYPKDGKDGTLESYDAVQVFAQGVRRVRTDFSLAAEQTAVVRICHLVEGLPLALELAAAWSKMLSCIMIAREIERNLDFLTTRTRNVPERHRSIAVVFESSWQRLSIEEQDVLKRLSVCRDGFQQTAAEQIGQASLMILAALVEKSMLHPAADGRYRLHELLRQFVAEKLRIDPGEQEAAQERHSAYYLTFLKQQEKTLKGRQQPRILTEIRAEIENIRAAWQWSVENDDVGKLKQVQECLFDFLHIRSRYQEGKEAFEQAAARLQSTIKNPKSEMILAGVLGRQGAFCYYLGLIEPAKERLQQSLEIARRLNAPRDIAFSLNFLGLVVWSQGEVDQTRSLLQESLAISREIGDLEGMSRSLHDLGFVSEWLGEYDKAKYLFRESLTLSQKIGNAERIAHSLDKLGAIAWYQGAYTESEQYYREGLTIFKEINNRFGMALTYGGLGLVALARGGASLAEAEFFFTESLILSREVGHRHNEAIQLGFLGWAMNQLKEYQRAEAYCLESLMIAKKQGAWFPLVNCLIELCDSSCHLGNFQTARQYLLEALDTAFEARLAPFAIKTLRSWSEISTREDHTETRGRTRSLVQAVELLVLVINHPATFQLDRDRAAALMTELEAELPPEVVVAAQERGRVRKLWPTAEKLLVENRDRQN